jgi:hypothetical protein
MLNCQTLVLQGQDQVDIKHMYQLELWELMAMQLQNTTGKQRFPCTPSIYKMMSLGQWD